MAKKVVVSCSSRELHNLRRKPRGTNPREEVEWIGLARHEEGRGGESRGRGRSQPGVSCVGTRIKRHKTTIGHSAVIYTYLGIYIVIITNNKHNCQQAAMYCTVFK